MSGDVNEWPAEMRDACASALWDARERAVCMGDARFHVPEPIWGDRADPPEDYDRWIEYAVARVLDAAVAFRDEAGNPVLVRADEISNWWEAEEARAEAAETQLRVREQSLETANAGWVAAKRERDEWERTAAQAYTLANFRAERVAELEYALRGLLNWAERYRGGDASLDPEEWYIESEHTKRVLAVQETEGT